MMSNIRVFIADDHAVLREALALLIGNQADMVVVGEAATGEEALRCASDSKPDVLVIDLSMPGIGGLDAIARLRQASPKTKSLVLTMHEGPAYVRAVLAAGAWGYVQKHAASAQVLTGIRELAAGRSFINVSMESGDLRDVLGEHPREVERTLTPRESEVLVLLAQGYSNSQIGARLGISKKSVDTYRCRLGEKLGLRGRAAIIRYALETGVLRASNTEAV